MLKISRNLQFCDREAFHNCTSMVVELPTNPVAEGGLPSCVVMELRFVRFQNHCKLSSFNKKCWWMCHPVYDLWRNYHRDDEEIKLEEVHLGPLFQSYKIVNLSDEEVATADCMVLPFQIRPCETRIRSEIFINSFIYRHETIGSTYEGAGWAFPTKTYWHTLPTHLHFQGYKIIHHSHFPPSTCLSHILRDALEPNWQLLAYYLEDGLYRNYQAPLQCDWNTAFNAHYHLAFHSNPTYKTQH